MTKEQLLERRGDLLALLLQASQELRSVENQLAELKAKELQQKTEEVEKKE